MGESFADLLDRFCDARHANYRSEPERQAVMQECMEEIMQTILEKLRDKFDPA